MKFQSLFIAGYFLLLGACSSANRAETVSVEIDPERTTPDSALLTDPEIILLETHPEALLSKIFAVDIYQDKLYIIDQRKDKILVFDREGHFLSTIGRRGRGPGEFSNTISDFCIDRENNEILIATDRPNKIMYFSLSGEYLGETPVEDLLYEMVKEDGKFYFRILHDKYEMAIYEMDGHTVKSIKYPQIPKLERIPGVIMTPLGRMMTASKYGILFARTFDNTIYKVEDDELIPFRTIDFGKYYLEDANALDSHELMQRVSQERIVYGITNARLIGEDQILFNGFPNGIFTVNGNTARQFGRLSNDLLGFGHSDIVPILDTETDYIAFSHSAVNFVHLLSGRDNVQFTDVTTRLSKIKEGDNPVLFLYKLKK